MNKINLMEQAIETCNRLITQANFMLQQIPKSDIKDKKWATNFWQSQKENSQVSLQQLQLEGITPDNFYKIKYNNEFLFWGEKRAIEQHGEG